MTNPVYHLRDPRLIGGNFADLNEIKHMLTGVGQCSLSGDTVILTTSPNHIRSYMKSWKWFDNGDGTFSITIAREHHVIRRMHLSVAKDPCPSGGWTRIYVYEPENPNYGRVLQIHQNHPFFGMNTPAKTLEDGYYRAYDRSTTILMDGMTDVTAILEIVNPHDLVGETFNVFWGKWATFTPTQQEKAGAVIARISNMIQEYHSLTPLFGE